MKRGVVEEPRVDKVHGEVRHPGQLDAAVDVAVDLGRDGRALLVDDRVHLLDDVKVGLVVSVLDTGPGELR